MPNINDLISVLASFLSEHEKSYTLPSACLRYGMDPGEEREAGRSKRSYVSKRLSSKSYPELLNIAASVIEDYDDRDLDRSLAGFLKNDMDQGAWGVNNKLFISHSSMDRDIAEALIQFLDDGINIDKNSIYYTSKPGTIKTGSYFINEIKKELLGCKAIIVLMSRNYLKSSFCLAELGAAWASNQNIITILIPPVGLEEYNKTPLQGIQALSLFDRNLPEVMYDHLSELAHTRASMIDFSAAAKVFQQKLERIQNNQFLEPIQKKVYMATVTEIRPRRNKRNEDCSICRLDGLIEGSVPPVQGETHWIFFVNSKYAPVSVGDRIYFKIEKVDDLYECILPKPAAAGALSQRPPGPDSAAT